jgi:hypothetical protein
VVVFAIGYMNVMVLRWLRWMIVGVIEVFEVLAIDVRMMLMM